MRRKSSQAVQDLYHEPRSHPYSERVKLTYAFYWIACVFVIYLVLDSKYAVDSLINLFPLVSIHGAVCPLYKLESSYSAIIPVDGIVDCQCPQRGTVSQRNDVVCNNKIYRAGFVQRFKVDGCRQ